LKRKLITLCFILADGLQINIFKLLLDTLLLRSEILSGMCAKLRIVAASNNRNHPRNLSYNCLVALHI